MKIYYISAENTEGEDIDHFVSAFTPDSAFSQWRTNALVNEWIEPNQFERNIIEGVPTIASVGCARIFEIQTTSTIGLLGWNYETSAGQAKLIGYVPRH